MKTPNTSSMLIARRLACTIAALAMLVWTCTPAQAEFYGTLQGNQTWTVAVNNSNNVDAAAVAIYSIDRMGKTEYFQIATVPGGQSVTLTVTRVPRGTVRVIIEVDPLIVANSAPVEVLVTQGAFGVSHLGPGPFRMVLDVI